MSITSEHTYRMKTSGAVFAAIVSLLLLLLCSSISSAELPDELPAGTTDLGDLWGYEIQFIYSPPSGSDVADTVEWDFGDSSSATGKIVSHRYEAIGDYLVKQTATNGIGSSDAYYVVHIKGYPSVTYNFGYDDKEVVKVQTQFKVAAELEDPVREGYTFSGWYTDAELINRYTGFSITVPTTLYAKWSTVEPSPVDPESNDVDWIPIALAAVGVLGVVVFVASRSPISLFVAIICLATALSVYTGVISWKI